MSPSESSDNLRATQTRPWLGLRSFTEQDADYFHGRSAELSDLLQRVLRQPLTVLFSHSGLGKTSLLAAGLIPALRNEGHRPVLLRLRLEMDAPALTDQLQQALDSVLPPAEHCARPASLWERLHRRDLAQDAEFQHNPPVLILDQFEEIFTLGMSRRPDEAKRCLSQLAELVENRVPAALLGNTADLVQRFDRTESPLRIVLALREDYLFHLDAWRVPMPSLMRNRMSLAMLSGPQALEAVLHPAAGAEPPIITPAAAEAIVRFVARAPHAELKDIAAVPPLLSLVCAELNEARLKRGTGAIQDSDVVGNADQILHDYYERCFDGQPSALRQLVEDQLVTKSGYRDSRAREEFEADLAKAGVPNVSATLDRLIQPHRLLSTDERSRQPRIELTHDVLASIVHASREKRREREASEQARQALALEAAKQRRRSLLVVGLMCLSGLAVCSAVYGLWQAKIAKQALADRQQSDTKLSHQLEASTRAALSRAKAAIGTSDSLAYYAEALRHSESMSNDKLSLEVRQFWNRNALIERPVEPIPLLGPMTHDGRLWSVRYSKDGTLLVSCCENGPVRIWDARTAREIFALPSETKGAFYADFHPLQSELVIAGGANANQAQRWTFDLVKREAKTVGRAQAHLSAVWCAAYSSDGSLIATGAADGRVGVWKPSHDEVEDPQQMRKHNGGVNQVRFSPADSHLLTASMDNTMGHWSTSAPKDFHLTTLSSPVRAAAIAREGLLAFAACNDGKVIPLDPATGMVTSGLRGATHTGLTWLDITPDLMRLVTAGNGYLAVLDPFMPMVGDASQPMQLVNQSNFRPSEITAVCLHPDGLSAAVGYKDGAVFVCGLVNETSLDVWLPHEGWAGDIVFTPDGQQVITTGLSKKVQVWDASSGRPLQTLGALGEAGQRLHLWSGFGKDMVPSIRLVATDTTSTFHVWDGLNPRVRTPESKHKAIVDDAVISSDGKTIVTADQANGLTIYALENLQEQRRIILPASSHDIALSADGARILAVAESHGYLIPTSDERSKGIQRELSHIRLPSNAGSFTPLIPIDWQLETRPAGCISGLARMASGSRMPSRSHKGAASELWLTVQTVTDWSPSASLEPLAGYRHSTPDT